MALPGDLTGVTVTGTYRDASGAPLAGSITFTPSTTLTDTTGSVVIPPMGRTYQLAVGTFQTDPLAPTDSADLAPAGWTYTVRVSLQDLPPFSFSALIPHSPSPVDISALTTVVPQGTPVAWLPESGGTMTGPLVTLVPNIVFDGDSLTNGTGSLPFNNFPASNDFPSQVVSCLDPKGIYYNVGVGGEQTATMITNAPTVVDTKLVAGANNIVCFSGGTNDLQSTDSATTTYGRIVTYCQARQAAGWKVVVGTLTPRSDAGTPGDFDTLRLSVNASIRANWPTFANAIADVGADPLMGTSGQETNNLYYNGDLVHHNPNGYYIRAGYFLAALSLLGVTGHRHSDRPGLISDLFIPAQDFYALAGSPTLGLISHAPVWQLHHGTVDAVAFPAMIPRDWKSYALQCVWSNTAGASGNAVLLCLTLPFNWGAAPSNLATTMTSGANQVVASPTGFRPVATTLGTFTPNHGGTPRSLMLLGIERNGTHASDTLTTDIVGLIGAYLYRIS